MFQPPTIGHSGATARAPVGALALRHAQNVEMLNSAIEQGAIWNMPKEGERPKARTGCLSVFDGNVWEKLNRDYVFIGFNQSCHKSPVEGGDLWRNFHSLDDRRQNDFKLRYALHGTKFWGAYMTDAIKCVRENVAANVKLTPKQIQENMVKLQEELDVLGGHPTLIAMGGNAYDVVSAHFMPKGYKVIGIMHFAYHIGKKNYRDVVLKALKNC